ncbi:MAG: RNA polymerase sigma factor [Clostridia bacterium]|nr:RNA polymerase sigma factor [Clostridia bacterium]
MSSEIMHDLVRQAQKGDIEAFGEIYSHYSKDLYRFALYWTSSQILAEDAVSETVLCAFENIKRLKKAESFKAWIFKILFNCCKQKQKEKAISKNKVPLENAIHICAAEKNGELSVEIQKALESLSSEERKIVILSFVCGYKSEEVGKMLSMKAGTVRSKLSRAAEKLRVFLKSETEVTE